MYSSSLTLPQNGKNKYTSIPPSYQGTNEIHQGQVEESGWQYEQISK